MKTIPEHKFFKNVLYLVEHSWVIILLLLFSLSFLIRSDNSFMQDLGGHLKTGEIIFKSGSVPTTNLFSYISPNNPYINNKPIFQLLIYLGMRFLGSQVLLTLKIILALLTVGLLFVGLGKKPSWLLLFLGYLFLHTIRDRLELRPEMASYFFSVVIFLILERSNSKETRLVWLLPIIQLIWVNSHIYFPVGLALIAIFLFDALYRGKVAYAKKMSLILALCIGVSFVNPNGLEGVLFPANFIRDPAIRVNENQNIFTADRLNLTPNTMIWIKAGILISLSSLIFAFYKKTLTLKNLLMILLGNTLAAVHIRSQAFLLFLAFPAVINNFRALLLPGWDKALISMTVVLIFWESLLYLNNSYYLFATNGNYSSEVKFNEGYGRALDFVLANRLPQPIVNDYAIGGYIAYRGYPEYKVFVDSRPEAYPEDFLRKIYLPMNLDYQNFRKVDSVAGFKTIIYSISEGDPTIFVLLANLSVDPAWKMVYLDGSTVIFINRTEDRGNKLPEIDLRVLKPEQYQFSQPINYINIAEFAATAEQYTTAKSFLSKALYLFPESPAANVLMSNILLKENPNNTTIAQKYQEKAGVRPWW